MAQILERRSKGSLALDELAQLCGIVQNMSVCKLVRISKKTDEPQGKFNLCLFEKVGLQDDVPNPTLVKITDADKVPAVIQEQIGSGKKFIFDSTIFVEDAEARVLGFR